MNSRIFSRIVCLIAVLLASVSVFAQDNPPKSLISPDVSPDRKVTFRVRAVSAKSVKLQGTDIPDAGGARAPSLEKGDDGVWSITVGPLPPGAYRYFFDVDGVLVLDPANKKISEANMNLWSLVHVPGNELYDTARWPRSFIIRIP